ncbi:hypothetical protein ABPG74_011281 [Tetrahymena malaccensis]
MALFDCIRCGLQLNEDTFQHTGCCGKVICRACVESLLVTSSEGIFERIFDCQSCILEVKNNKLKKNMYLGMLIESVQQSKTLNNWQATKTLSDLSQTDIQNQKFQVKINCGRCNSENIKTICVCETCNKSAFSKEKMNQSSNRVLFQDYSQLVNVSQSQYLCEACCDIIHSVGDYLKHSIQKIPVSYFQQQVVNRQKQFELKQNSNSANNDSIFNSSNINLSHESCQNNTKNNKCKIHINENYKKICSKDFEILCDSCSNKHLNICSGNIINVDIAHRDFIHNLFLNVENLQLQKTMLRNEADTLQSVIQQLNQVKQNAKKHIQSQISDLIMLLKAKEDQILRQVDNSISQKQLQVQDYMKEVLNKIDQYNNLSDLMYAAINSEEYYKFDLLGSLPFFTNKYKETLNFDQKKPINHFTQLSDLYQASSNLQGQISPVEINQIEEAKILFLSLSLKGFKDEQTTQPSNKNNLNLFQAINTNQIIPNFSKHDVSRKNNLKSPHSNSQSNMFGKNSSHNSNSSSQNTSQKEIDIQTDIEKSQNTIQNTLGQISSSSSLSQMISHNSLNQLNNNQQAASGAHLASTNNNNNRLNTPKQTTRKTNTITSQTNKSNGSFSNLNVNPLANSIDFNSIVSAKCGSVFTNNQSIISTTLESEKSKNSAKKTVSQNIGNFGISQVSSFCENITSTPAGGIIASSGVNINDQLSTKNQRSNITNSQLLSQKVSPTDSNYQSTNSSKPSKVPDRTNKNMPSSSSTISSAREQQNSSQRESSRSRVQQQSSTQANQQNTPVKRSPSITKKSLEPTNSNRQSASRSSHQSSTNGKSVAKSLHDITDMLSNHDLIQYSELAKNPLAKRVITKTYSTSTSIMLQWTHSAYYQGDIKYAVEFGIGMKIGGKEQFKQVYLGSSPQYVIEGLQPKTTYKVRVCAIQSKKKDTSQMENPKDQQKNENSNVVHKIDSNLVEEETTSGEWSDVQSVCTQELQTIEPSECAQIIRKEKEIVVQYDTPGIATSLYPYFYGKISWDITASVASHACGEDTTACLIVGVTNKLNKKFSIVGSTINYGLHRETLKIKVQLDFNKNIMVIYTPSQPLGEVYNSLPLGGLYPAFQNKTSQKTTLSNLKLKITFEEQ